jgi:uncharacterized protein (DUF2141 family)
MCKQVLVLLMSAFSIFIVKESKGQCGNLTATATSNESRCTATGSIVINASGGTSPERYQYKIAIGPITTSYSNSNTFAGLPPGNYTIQVRDVTANCFITLPVTTVAGNYRAPGIFYSSTPLTCINGANGTIYVTNQTNGRAPFSYQLIAPSASNIGTTSTNGTFTGLIPGLYTIRMTDSCGGIQTRNQRVDDFSWSILPNSNVIKSSCQNIDVNVFLTNTNGINSPNAAYNGFKYGITTVAGDTSWFTTASFNYFIGNSRSASIVVKDACGFVIKSFNWSDNIPSVGANVNTSDFTCASFTATITGQTNLNTAFTEYSLYNATNTTVVKPIQSSPIFTGIPHGSYTVRITDKCYDTTILRWVATTKPVPSVTTVTTTAESCATFSATVTGQLNITNATYQLFNNTNNTQIGSNQTSEVFNNIPYGSYCIRIINDAACYDTTIVSCFSQNKAIPSFNPTTFVTNRACNTFRLRIGGLTNFTNPIYQLFNSNTNIQFGTNQTDATFNNVPYGSYLIKIINDANCYDTTVTHNITVTKNIPRLTVGTSISNNGCATFDVAITKSNENNVHNERFQLFNATNNTALGIAQSSNIFNNVTYGSYCVRVINDPTCYDTTFVHCFTVSKPIPVLDGYIDISDRTCNTITATGVITNQQNIYNPIYQLFNGANNTQIGANQTSPIFTNIPYGSYCIRMVNDATCYDTTIVACFTEIKPLPSVGTAVSISNQTCATFTATINGQSNINNATYQLFDAANNTQIGSNQNSPVFDNIPNGSYCIRIVNDPICYDTTIVRCFTVSKQVPALDAFVTATDKTCATFTANVNFNASSNLTNITYQLFDGTNNTQIGTTQHTPAFTLLPYGSYCIRVINDASCYDTTFIYCFTEYKPIPSVGANVEIGNKACATFTATVVDAININNATYQLFNAANDTQIGSNQTSASFTNIAYGSYCIRVVNDPACYDTTIVRCFTVEATEPTLTSSIITSNKTCNTFTASVNIISQNNVYNLQYKLYDATNTNQIGATQTDGVFNNLPYGKYYIRMVNDLNCFDITFMKTINEPKPLPSVNNTVDISNKSCATFTATIGGQTNISNPVYKLFNAANDTQIGADQTSNVFNNIPYGSYCIRVVNDAVCHDTTIVRCFTVNGTIIGASISNVTSNSTCTEIGASDIGVNTINGSLPIIYSLYDPTGTLVSTTSYNANSYTFYNMAGLPAGTKYKVVIEDACANRDSAFVTPNGYYVNRNIDQITRCPSGSNADGTGDVNFFIDQNISEWSYFTIRIIKKNGVELFVNPSSSSESGKRASFTNLAPGTYIFETINYWCWKFNYDTVKVERYTYPNMSNSKGYICDNGLQSIGCDTKGGAWPLQYQIFESIPSSPNINTAYQTNPVFDINNGTLYALVRLRVLDACGNASINDVGFVPVATTIIQSTNDCFYAQTVLSVDTVANATYTWYKRTYNPIDSVLLTTGDNYTIPFLTVTDTGTYICKTYLNNGCITNIAYKNVKGNCKAAVGNYVWLENSIGPNANNGFQDPGEKGVAGVLVTLRNDMGVTVATTVTDSSGYYLFSDINPGQYSIKVNLPNGYQYTTQTNTDDNENSICDHGSDINSTTGETYMFTLEKGENEMDIDAGIKLRLNVLPVKLETFTATPDKGHVQLKWTVAEEINVLMYEVEYATSPNNFSNSVGTVIATKAKNYSTLHKTPILGTNYYRLKIIDKDGKISYSEIKVVQLGRSGSISVYPNPVVTVANITFANSMVNKSASIKLLGENGQVLLSKEIVSLSNLETLDVSNLPNGKYIVRIFTENEVTNLPIQVLR